MKRFCHIALEFALNMRYVLYGLNCKPMHKLDGLDTFLDRKDTSLKRPTPKNRRGNKKPKRLKLPPDALLGDRGFVPQARGLDDHATFVPSASPMSHL